MKKLIKMISVYAAALLILAPGCTKKTYPGHDNIAGCWRGTVSGQEIVFVIDKKGANSYTGVVATFKNGVKTSETALHNTTFSGTTLHTVTNKERNICYTGILDTNKQVITGNLVYAGGKNLPLNCVLLQTAPAKKVLKSISKPLHPYRHRSPQTPVIAEDIIEVSLQTNIVKNLSDEEKLTEKDIITVINRWQGTILPHGSQTGPALMTACALDPAIEAVSTQWKNDINECTNTADKVKKIGMWAYENLAYTQGDKQFASLPGRDPWGVTDTAGNPTFKKLLPSEMKAMSIFTGKISGKCLTLVNFITSCFLNLGVPADDIIVLVVKQGGARHAMALVRYEEEILFVNLMFIDLLKNHIDDISKSYQVLGVYNHTFSLDTDFILETSHLQKIMENSDTPLVQRVFRMFSLPEHTEQRHYTQKTHWASRKDLWSQIFFTSHGDYRFDLAKYAYQSLYVQHPGLYLNAGLKTSHVKDLAGEFKKPEDVFRWIKGNIRYGSIFPDAESRIMTADQVLVFMRGGYKDQAILAGTLLKHMGYNPSVHMGEYNSWIELDNTFYDVKLGKKSAKHSENIVMEIQ